jgi:hypothetical protein
VSISFNVDSLLRDVDCLRRKPGALLLSCLEVL